ncbi:hypothetical protein HTH_0243 [Hydrogenobacter thermophilus TK-6]|uniref:Uncharacterized protein n=1 Tax=Hydrogenobacter thermophilus (strain DSM 6534 / IAM 12695 / TK-6) TaxID=608538 RepID=D3DFV8_HYDTT|nr:hypothetical protein HTH_0243 [Hydrogenobacter thermophilus TK-6]
MVKKTDPKLVCSPYVQKLGDTYLYAGSILFYFFSLPFKNSQHDEVIYAKFGDRVYDFHLASLYVLGRFALYNLMVFAKLLLLCFLLLRAVLFFAKAENLVFEDLFNRLPILLTHFLFRYILNTQKKRDFQGPLKRT